MTSKTLKIGDRDVEFRSSAATPRMYRLIFKRDLFVDLKKLAEAAQANASDDEDFAIEDMEMFENVAYVMAKSANPDIPKIDEWLEQFEMFSIYEILPDLLSLWGENMFTLNSPAPSKKKRVTGK